MIDVTEDFYWYWLCNIPSIGNAKIRAILNIFASAKEVYAASEKLLRLVNGLGEKEINNIIESRKDTEIYKDFIAMKEIGINFVHAECSNYPQRLKKIFDAPFGIYYKGRLPKEDVPTAAIIGARNCTNYGREIATLLGYELSKQGVQIISGMARGIDSYGHIGAINSGGSTFGVLGCGPDVCYPRENINIYMDVLENGGIISEYPAGTQPLAHQFPMRNRIISGLADVVIVVEAREKSGSLITVDQALEQNKEVMVVPGRIGDRLSEGCNNLIKLGAQVITRPEDVFEELGLDFCNKSQASVLNSSEEIYEEIYEKSYEKSSEKISEKDNIKDGNIYNSIKNSTDDTYKCNIPIASLEKKVYSCVDLFPKNLNIIIEETGLNTCIVTDILLNLELRNYIREVSKNNYVRIILKE